MPRRRVRWTGPLFSSMGDRPGWAPGPGPHPALRKSSASARDPSLDRPSLGVPRDHRPHPPPSGPGSRSRRARRHVPRRLQRRLRPGGRPAEGVGRARRSRRPPRPPAFLRAEARLEALRRPQVRLAHRPDGLRAPRRRQDLRPPGREGGHRGPGQARRLARPQPRRPRRAGSPAHRGRRRRRHRPGCARAVRHRVLRPARRRGEQACPDLYACGPGGRRRGSPTGGSADTPSVAPSTPAPKPSAPTPSRRRGRRPPTAGRPVVRCFRTSERTTPPATSTCCGPRSASGG